MKNKKVIIDPTKKLSFKAAELDIKALKILANEERIEILKLLAAQPMYPKRIAEKLGMHEQRVYYHLRLLKKAGLVKEIFEENKLLKFYSTEKQAYCFIPEYAEKLEMPENFYPSPPEILEGFIENGKINCKIVIGAPYPHGKYNKASKSGYLAGEVACLLGRYGISEKRLIYTDEELSKNEKKDNLIIIAGMHVNTLQKEVNEKLPIKFDKHGTKIISTISKEEYVDSDCGFICRAKNPFDKSKSIIVIAGLESVSTKACVFAFKNELEKINKGNMYNRKIKARVVKAVDEKIIFLE